VQPATWVGDHQVEQQREGEAGGEHTEAPHKRRSPVPAHPHRREPDQTGEYGQLADPSCRAAEGGDQAGGHQRESGCDGERGGQAGVSGVGGEPAGTLRDCQSA
jgi:hypothetical protein